MAETDCACTVGYAEEDPRIPPRDHQKGRRKRGRMCCWAELVSGCVGFGSPAVAVVDGIDAGEIAAGTL